MNIHPLRSTLLILALALSATFCRAADEVKFDKVPSDDFSGYIVPKAFATQNLKDQWKDVTEFWTPTADQAKAAAAAIKKAMNGSKDDRNSFFMTADGKDLKEYFEEQSQPFISDNFDKYAIEFVGVTAGGKKQVLCHYVLVHTKLPDVVNTYLTGAPDNGITEWNVRYDLASKTCVDYEDTGT